MDPFQHDTREDLKRTAFTKNELPLTHFPKGLLSNFKENLIPLITSATWLEINKILYLEN